MLKTTKFLEAHSVEATLWQCKINVTFTMTPRISDVVLHHIPTKYSTLRIIIREFLCVDGQGNGASGIIFLRRII